MRIKSLLCFLAIALCANASIGPYMGFWQSIAEEEISNPNVNLRATSGSWTSGADTVEKIPANTDGKLCITLNDADHTGSANTNYFMSGLTDSGNTPVGGYAGIDFALYVRLNDLRVYESGGQKDSGNSFTDGQTACVVRDGGTGAITYTLDGVVFYTSADTMTAELKGDFCGLDTNDRALDIQLERGNGLFNPNYADLTLMTNY